MNEFLEALNTPLFSVGEQHVILWQVIAAPTTLALGIYLMRLAGRLITRRLVAHHVNANSAQLIRRLFYFIAVTTTILITLYVSNVPLTAFAFVSGAVAIGVGFGAQNIINNFISGWILMWERPIKIGDFLEIGADTRGTVEAINTRSTKIRRIDGVHLLVPNSHLLENMVVNWTLVDHLARTMVRVGVAYGSPERRTAQLIEAAVTSHEHVLRDPEPMIIFEDFGDSALIFDAYMWVNATADRDLRTIRSDIRFRISEIFRENGIKIAYPQHDVHVDGSLTFIDEKMRTAQPQPERSQHD